MGSFLTSLSSTTPEMPAWILAATGFYFAYRVLKFPDVTVDGAFVIGSVAAAAAAIHSNSSVMGLFLAIIFGALAGILTSGLYLLNPRPGYKLLSGVFVVLGLYSLDFRLLDRKVECSFASYKTSMNALLNWEAIHDVPITLIIGVLLFLVVDILLYWLMKTRFGLDLRTVGTRPHFEGLKAGRLLLSGLVISNVTVAIGGWYYGSINAYARVGILSVIIHPLAISIIGELVLDHIPFLKDKQISPIAILATPLVGAVIYLFVKAGVSFYTVDLTADQVSINQHANNAIVATVLVVILLFAMLYGKMSGKHTSDEFYSGTGGDVI